MAGDDKKTKTSPTSAPTPKKEPASKDKSASADKSAPAVERPEAKADEPAAASSSSYSRGEGQKPVSKAYKDNWNAIFAKKKKKR